MTLRGQGYFAEAVASLRRGHERGSTSPGWRLPSARWLRETERWLELEARLPALLKGDVTPSTSNEQLEYAQVCRLKGLHGTAAGLYAAAFATAPKLADDLNGRYAAACSAALAGSGQGRDATNVPTDQRAGLRKQSLEWLQANLKAWASVSERNPRSNDFVARTMTIWQTDPDLAHVRDEAALEKLPADEQSAWRQFWAEVSRLRQAAERGAKSAKR